MRQAEILKAIETTLQHCRGLAASVGDRSLAYFIEMAIYQAGKTDRRGRDLRRDQSSNDQKLRARLRLAVVNNE